MKTELIPDQTPTFPALYMNEIYRYVVLFTSHCSGTVVYVDENPRHPFVVGYHSNNWGCCVLPAWIRLSKGTKLGLEQT